MGGLGFRVLGFGVKAAGVWGFGSRALHPWHMGFIFEGSGGRFWRSGFASLRQGKKSDVLSGSTGT